MAKLSRVNQEVFGETGGTTEFGKIGSDAAGAPTTTKDLALIQSLSQYKAGLFAITANKAEPPRIEDINALYYLVTSQLRYLMQNGIPEWIATAEYYADVSFVQVSGVVYRSVYGTDGTPNLNHNPATDDGTYWEPGEEYLRQLKHDAIDLGLTGYSLTDKFLFSKLQIAYSKSVGETVLKEFFEDPVTFANARSTSNPSNAEYNPVIPRHDGNHDVASTQAPLLVTKLRGKKLAVSGYDSFACTVSGSVITVSGPSTTVRDALLGGLIAAGLVNQWHVTEAATFAGSGALYTGARQYCANINGVDYAITGVNLGTSQITVTGTPASGSQTLIIYPFRIAGEAAKIRLRKRTGFVPVVANDYTAKVLIGLDIMDEEHGHWHNWGLGDGSGTITLGETNWFNSTPQGSFYTGRPSKTFNNTVSIREAITDGTNGTPRIGKNTSPRSFGVGMYTFARTLLATDWTTAA